MIILAVWVAFTFLIANLNEIDAHKCSVCYYRSWAQSYTGKARFRPQDIDVHLCSVINYASNRININTLKIEGRQTNDAVVLKDLVALKKINPSLLIQVTVGGWNHEKLPRFVTMVHHRRGRVIFIKSVISYLNHHRLDGINIDWEYPGVYTRKEKHKFPIEREKDKARFISLLKKMKKAFRKYAKKQNTKRFLLTLSVAATRKKLRMGYNVPNISAIVDWIDIMAYNLRGPWRHKAGCPTLMKGNVPNVPESVKAWIHHGMSPSKINLGLASYGRTFNLSDASNYNIGDPTTGKGAKGAFTKKEGILAYYEICNKIWKHKTSWRDSLCGAPYASDGITWVSYEDPSSVENKVSSLVNGCNLHGISLWALDFDDFSGKNCKEGRYPLLNSAVKTMANQITGKCPFHLH